MGGMHDTGIYCITDMQSGRFYVGSAVSIKKRWREHRNGLKRGQHHSQFMQRTYRARPDAFAFQVLLYCTPENLLMYEQRFLDAWNPEFNTNPTAGSMLGYRHGDETRRKMSESNNRTGNPGYSHTPESKARISRNRSGKGGGYRSPERCARISAALKGRVIPQEVRDRISETLTGRSTGRGVLSEDQVREIRKLWAVGLRQSEIASAVGVAPLRVHTVVRGHGYQWVSN